MIPDPKPRDRKPQTWRLNAKPYARSLTICLSPGAHPPPPLPAPTPKAAVVEPPPAPPVSAEATPSEGSEPIWLAKKPASRGGRHASGRGISGGTLDGDLVPPRLSSAGASGRRRAPGSSNAEQADAIMASLAAGDAPPPEAPEARIIAAAGESEGHHRIIAAAGESEGHHLPFGARAGRMEAIGRIPDLERSLDSLSLFRTSHAGRIGLPVFEPAREEPPAAEPASEPAAEVGPAPEPPAPERAARVGLFEQVAVFVEGGLLGADEGDRVYEMANEGHTEVLGMHMGMRRVEVWHEHPPLIPHTNHPSSRIPNGSTRCPVNRPS